MLEPNAKGYYRLKWTEPDGTPGDTSAGRILEHALEKATEIDDRVTSAAGPKTVTALEAVAAAYLAAGHSPYKDKKPWNQKRSRVSAALCRSIDHARKTLGTEGGS